MLSDKPIWTQRWKYNIRDSHLGGVPYLPRNEAYINLVVYSKGLLTQQLIHLLFQQPHILFQIISKAF